jgi:hypothetical protein
MSFATILLVTLLQNGVNPDAALVSQFQDHLADYLKSTAKLKSDLPPLKTTDSREAVTAREAGLAKLIVQARPKAAAGDFFTPSIAKEFRRLIAIAFEGPSQRRILKSLEHAEPVDAHIAVNASYPAVPLQSMPPSLLANLPRLPTGLDYRIVGRSLVLRDVQANLILDFIPKALP